MSTATATDYRASFTDGTGDTFEVTAVRAWSSMTDCPTILVRISVNGAPDNGSHATYTAGPADAARRIAQGRGLIGLADRLWHEASARGEYDND